MIKTLCLSGGGTKGICYIGAIEFLEFNDYLKFPKLQTKEDFVLWLKFLKSNNKIMGLNETLVYWRKLDNSLSSSLVQKLFDGFRVYNKYMNYNYLKSLYLLSCLCFNFFKKNG